MDSLVHAIAGSVGGMTAMGLTYPLDQVRTIQQVNDDKDLLKKYSKYGTLDIIRHVVDKHGWGMLYQGLLSTQLAMGGSNFVYFYFYTSIKDTLIKKLNVNNKEHFLLPPLQNLAVASLAGVINVFATSPLWVVNLRLKADTDKQYNGIQDCFSQIYHNEGLLPFWKGTIPSLILVSNPVIHYFSYDRMKERLLKFLQKHGLNALEIFFLGSIAKLIATLATYPMQVAQSRMRVQKDTPTAKDKSKGVSSGQGMMACLIDIFQKDGLKGLYVGCEAKVLQTVLTAAITLLAYEKIVAIIFALMYNKKLLQSTKL